MNFTKVGDRIRILKTIIDYERSTKADRKIKTFFIGSTTMEELDDLNAVINSLEEGFKRFNESGFFMADGSPYRIDFEEIKELHDKLKLYREDKSHQYYKERLPELVKDFSNMLTAMVTPLHTDETKMQFRPTKKQIKILEDLKKNLEHALNHASTKA